MKKNLKNRRSALGLSQAKFANLVQERCGETFSQQAYQKLEANPEAKSSFMHIILALFDELEGNVLTDQGDISKEPPTTLQPHNLESDFIQVPVYDVQLAAGNGTHVDHDNIVESLPISRKYLSDSGISADSATIVKVRGESMEHTLCDGDVVLVNTGISKPVSGKIFAFDFDGDLRVKRFIKRLDGSWRIVSDNEDKNIYADETLSAHNVEQLRLIGQVVTIVERKL
ncbi:S24 family peptidase [Neptunomonas sp.]